jgi:hypothetical protein
MCNLLVSPWKNWRNRFIGNSECYMSFVICFCYMIHETLQWISILRFSFPRIVYEGLWSWFSPDHVGAGWRDTCTCLLRKQYRLVKWGTGVNMGDKDSAVEVGKYKVYILCDDVMCCLVLFYTSICGPLSLWKTGFMSFSFCWRLCVSRIRAFFVIRVPHLPMRNFFGFNNVFYVWGMSKTVTTFGEKAEGQLGSHWKVF